MSENRLSMAVERSLDVGALLREARERRGVSLKQVAEVTKISVTALEALERNDLSHLPGGIFTRAFVRAYASEVGLDVDQTVRQFVEQFPSEDPSVAERPSRTASHGGLPASRDGRLMRLAARVVTVVVFLAAVVAYLAWSGRLASWRRGAAGEPAAGEAMAAPPQTAQADAEPAGAALPGRNVPEAALPGQDVPEAVSAEPPRAEPPAAPPPEQAARPAAPVEEAGVWPVPSAIPEGTLRVFLAPRGPCWVSLRVDGEPVFSALMSAGETREIDARGTVMLTAGDAGAFAFSVNGIQGRPLGGPGQVVTIVLTPRNYAKYLLPQ